MNMSGNNPQLGAVRREIQATVRTSREALKCGDLTPLLSPWLA
jgi:hypothetical protein